jgi:hypothetical protein
MLSPQTFTKDWLNAKAKASGAVNAQIFERCVHALELVGRLAEAKLDFIFKGGTSLILHLEPVRRLSVDVDIACLEPLERVTEVLDQIIAPPFTRWEYQNWRDGENPPTKYFKVCYPTLVGPEQEMSIQLDVLVQESPYPEVETKEIRTSFLEVESPVAVKIPSVNCLLGDKLAAFAPTTIGVLYQPFHKKTGEPTEPRPIRVMKQLFDVGELFAAADDLPLVAETYQRIFVEQNKYRGSKFTVEQALDDTLDAAYWLTQMSTHPVEKNEKTEFFRAGIEGLNNHLIGFNFGFPNAQTAASRAALIATAIRTGRLDQSLADFRAVPGESALRQLRIEGQWQKLFKVRRTNTEAFYNWHQAERLMLG